MRVPRSVAPCVTVAAKDYVRQMGRRARLVEAGTSAEALTTKVLDAAATVGVKRTRAPFLMQPYVIPEPAQSQNMFVHQIQSKSSYVRRLH